MPKKIDLQMQAFQANLLEAVRDMKAGHSARSTQVKSPDTADARTLLDLTQAEFKCRAPSLGQMLG